MKEGKMISKIKAFFTPKQRQKFHIPRDKNWTYLICPTHESQAYCHCDFCEKPPPQKLHRSAVHKGHAGDYYTYHVVGPALSDVTKTIAMMAPFDLDDEDQIQAIKHMCMFLENRRDLIKVGIKLQYQDFKAEVYSVCCHSIGIKFSLNDDQLVKYAYKISDYKTWCLTDEQIQIVEDAKLAIRYKEE